MKRTIRLTESDLHHIITESVKNILTEIGDTRRGQYMLGRTLGRAYEIGDSDTMKNVQDRIGPLKQDHKNPAHWGYMNQTMKHPNSTVKANYKRYRDSDIADLRSRYLDFERENYIDYYDDPNAPRKDIIQDFEKNVLGHKMPQDLVDELTKEPERDRWAEYESSYDYDYNYNNPDYYPFDDDDEEWSNSILALQDEDY